ncbi:MAG: pseudouridine synthase [Alcaligenaceae bacterium]|nr:pseudouridine synthase [Alcaligenaceae bacterium]
MKAPLPMRGGVNPSRLYLPRDGQWSDLLSFLFERFPYMPAEILKARLAAGEMVNAEGVPFSLSSAFEPDSWLWYYREVPDEVEVPFDIEILYQDKHLLAVDKPHFLASIPSGRYVHETVLSRLRKQFDLAAISPIHRLDRETAGVLLFSLRPEDRGAYQSLFQTRQVTKFYEAIAPTVDGLEFPLVYQSHIIKSPQYFTMMEVDKPSNSETKISVLKRGERLSHYYLEPLSGRKHQLRVHMNALGMPICHDGFYPVLGEMREADDFSDPLQLLARAIEFEDPITGQQRRFESHRELALQGDVN